MKKMLLNVSIAAGLLIPMHSAKAELHEIREFYNKASGVVSRLAAKDKLPLYQELIAALEKVKEGDKPFKRLDKDETTSDFTIEKKNRPKLVEFAKAAKELREKVGEQCKDDESTKEFWKIMDNCIAIGMGETFLTSDKREVKQDADILVVEKLTGQCFYELNQFLEVKAKKVELSAMEKTFSEKLKETADLLFSKKLESFKSDEDSKAKKSLDKIGDKVCKIEEKKEDSSSDKIKKEESDKKAKEEKEKKEKEEQESKSKKPDFKQEGSPATGKLNDPGAAGGQPTPPPGTGTPGTGGAGPAFPPQGFQPSAGPFDPSSNAGQNPFDLLNGLNPFANLLQPPQLDQSQRREGDRTGGNRTENPPQQQPFIPPQQDNNNDRQQPQQPEPIQPQPQQPAPIPVGNQQQQGMDPLMLAMLLQMMQNNNRPQAAPLASTMSQDAILAGAKAAAEAKAKELGQGFALPYGAQQYGNFPMTGGGPLLGGAVGSRPFGRLNKMQSVKKGLIPAFSGTGKNNLNYINTPRPAPSGEGLRGGLGKFN